jgi:hypothetical protein
MEGKQNNPKVKPIQYHLEKLPPNSTSRKTLSMVNIPSYSNIERDPPSNEIYQATQKGANTKHHLPMEQL